MLAPATSAVAAETEDGPQAVIAPAQADPVQTDPAQADPAQTAEAGASGTADGADSAAAGDAADGAQSGASSDAADASAGGSDASADDSAGDDDAQEGAGGANGSGSGADADAPERAGEPQEAPVDVDVAISGKAVVGGKLTAAATVSKPSELAATNSISWYADDARAATGPSYTVKSADLGKRIKAVADVAWEGDGAYLEGRAQGASAQTGAVVKQAASVTIKKVRIAGTPAVGETLTAKMSVSKTSGLPITSSFTWYVNGKKAKTGKTFTVAKKYDKASIKVRYTAKWGNGTYVSGSKTKSATVKVKKKASVTIKKVRIAGTPVVGAKLTAKMSVKKTKGLPIASSFTWYVNGKKAKTGKTFTVAKKYDKASIKVVYTAKWGNGTYASGSKAKSATVKVKKKASVTIKKVRIAGTPVVGAKLTAKMSVKKTKGLPIASSFTWYVNGKKAKTGKTFTIAQKHAHASIKVVYKAKWGNGTYASGSKTKSATVTARLNPQAIVSGAMSQLGVYQDCTALVERSLRAAGVPAGDLGTQAAEYAALGGRYVGDYAPGDVLVWGGRHVAVYIGNGQAVHGGYGGNRTVVASAFIDGPPSSIIRFS